MNAELMHDLMGFYKNVKLLCSLTKKKRIWCHVSYIFSVYDIYDFSPFHKSVCHLAKVQRSPQTKIGG